eukprot:12176560-Alexandrium_andersonii.AAC.1
MNPDNRKTHQNIRKKRKLPAFARPISSTWLRTELPPVRRGSRHIEPVTERAMNMVDITALYIHS